MNPQPQNAPPRAHIEVRDAVWRVTRVDTTSSGSKAWHVVGISEIVRDQDAIFLEEYEPSITVLDPRKTDLTLDTSPISMDTLEQNNAFRTQVEKARWEVIVIDEAHSVAERAVEHTLDDDTQPGGPRERTIVYEAPFDRCDREQDYEIAWKHFEQRFAERGET